MTQIVDINGNPIRQSVLTEPQTEHDSARIGFLHREFAEHPSQRLTPQRLITILNEAETGDIKRQAELFTDMEERDPQIAADMQKRTGAALTIDYNIIAPEGADKRERSDADYLRETVQFLPGFSSMLLDCQSAVGQAFANIELEWTMLGRERTIKEFHFRPHNWFTLDKNNQNRLLLRTQDGDGVSLQSFGWIQHRCKARSGYVARTGLHRTLAWPYLFRNFGVQSLAELLEVYGIPVKIGKYPSGTGKSEQRDLLRAVMALGRSAGGIIPQEMQIEITEAASGSADPFMALVNWAEKSISKCILGATLTSQADGKSSTNALGDIHNEIRHDLLRSDMRQLGETLTRDLLWPLLVLNRGQYSDPRRMPRIVFDVQDQVDAENISKLIPTLVDYGYKIPASWVRKKTNIPEPDSDEEILTSPGNTGVLPQLSFLTQQLAQLTQQITEIRTAATASEVNLPLPFNAPNADALRTLLTAQNAIDNAAANAPQGEPAAAMLAPVLAKLAGAENLDDTQLLALVADAFPTMDASLLAGELTQIRTIARLVGMFQAQQGRE